MKNIKELREYNNLTQKEVAQHIGVSDRVYSYYENGRTLPAKYVKPLANLFGISCDEFLENGVDLSDHGKQVRKEAIGDLKEELKKNGKCSIRVNGTMDFFIELYKLNEILDQIQD